MLCPVQVFPKLDAVGIDLMQKMFMYDPAKRITVSTPASQGPLLKAPGFI